MYCSVSLSSRYTLPVHILSCLDFCASFNLCKIWGAAVLERDVTYANSNHTSAHYC